MATSGNKSVMATSSTTLRFRWERTSKSIQSNSSIVSWVLEHYIPEGYTISSTGSKSWSVTVNGTKYSGTNSVAHTGGAYKTLASGETEIVHNTDGSKTFSYSFSQQYAITYDGQWVGTISGSGSGTLDDLPRPASITSAPDFTDEDNPTITYNNTLGMLVEELQVGIFTNDGQSSYAGYRDIPINKTSYTFNLTDAERANLRKAVKSGSSIAVRFYIKSVAYGVTYLKYVTKTLTLVNHTPVFLDDTDVYDVGTYSTQITGNPNVLIKGYNVAFVNYSAMARKEATITKLETVCNGKTYTGAKIGYVESGIFTLTATDSRGNTTTKTIEKTLIDYVKPTCTLTAEGELINDTVLNINCRMSGNWFDGDFGAEYNYLALEYRYKVNDGTYSDWFGVEEDLEVSNNQYSVDFTVSNLNYQNTYTIQTRIVDSIGLRDNTRIAESAEQVINIIPVFDWSNQDFNFNVPVSFQGEMMADFVVETGTEAMGTNGTWYWSKWASGKAECYGLRNYGNMGVSTAWGSVYISEPFTQSLPFGLFKTTPDFCNISYAGSSSDWAAFIIPRLPANATTSCGFYVARPTSGTISQAKINFHILGRWK